MFERYTEKARRSIFFARYECSALGSAEIGAEHLLLGLLREDHMLRDLLGLGALEQIRQAIKARSKGGESTPTSVDLPLTGDAQRALQYADEESRALFHRTIDCGHLVLGLLRLKECAALLGEHGIEYSGYRESVGAAQAEEGRIRKGRVGWVEQLGAPEEFEQTASTAALSLRVTILTLFQLVAKTAMRVEANPDDYGDQRLKRNPWTRKEALGHLVDFAAAHQQWFARALTEPKLVTPGYPPDDWVAAQRYVDFAWRDLVDLWLCLNRLLMHVLQRMPEEKLITECRIGVEDPIPFGELVSRYVEHCEDIVGQILARL
jgi:hypothetical protein